MCVCARARARVCVCVCVCVKTKMYLFFLWCLLHFFYIFFCLLANFTLIKNKINKNYYELTIDWVIAQQTTTFYFSRDLSVALFFHLLITTTTT